MSFRNQVEFVNLEDLVSKDHNYRKFPQVLDFESIYVVLRKKKKDNPNEGYGVERLFRCLLLQHLEDLSDRELERYLQENTAAKWFCGFSLMEKVPDHTVFTQFRNRIGIETVIEIFENIRLQLKRRGLMNEVFTFIDASHLISKADLWKERDEAIRKKHETLNNENVSAFAADPDVRFGTKGGNKHWIGYKRHKSVDCQSGLINKSDVSLANLPDCKGIDLVCPNSGASYADKAYYGENVAQIAAIHGTELKAIKQNSDKNKNYDLDRYLSGLRATYERVFSKMPHKTKFRGLTKNRFINFFQTIAFNLKRLCVIMRSENSLVTP
jgi:IS5 family transposase